MHGGLWKDLGDQEGFGAWTPQVCLSWGGRSGILGGFRPNSLCALPALELLKAGWGLDKVLIGMDVATSEFCREGKSNLGFKSPPGPQAPHHRGTAPPELHQGLPWCALG